MRAIPRLLCSLIIYECHLPSSMDHKLTHTNESVSMHPWHPFVFVSSKTVTRGKSLRPNLLWWGWNNVHVQRVCLSCFQRWQRLLPFRPSLKPIQPYLVHNGKAGSKKLIVFHALQSASKEARKKKSASFSPIKLKWITSSLLVKSNQGRIALVCLYCISTQNEMSVVNLKFDYKTTEVNVFFAFLLDECVGDVSCNSILPPCTTLPRWQSFKKATRPAPAKFWMSELLGTLRQTKTSSGSAMCPAWTASSLPVQLAVK